MKKLLISTLSASVLFAAQGVFAAESGFVDTAEVIRAQPIYRSIEIAKPRQECWQEEVREPVRRGGHSSNAAGAMILGGVIGGVVGHAIGHNAGKRHSNNATIAGTLIGAAIGHDQAERDQPRYAERVRHEQHCREYTDYESEERLDGYRVTYRFHGEEFTTRMPYDPGHQVQVRVQVTPLLH